MAGNFLSRPKRDGPGECDTNEKMGLSYGVIGVQGWRMSMEDAHICICDLKEHCESTLNCSPELLAKIPDQSSLFAVFDGHGGEEVAMLCSRKFPNFLVEDENFEKSDFEAALKSTYMRMDDYIKSPEGQLELQEILDQSAQAKADKEEDEEDDDDLDEEMENGDQDSEEEIRTGDCDDDDNEEGDEEDEEGGEAVSECTGQLLNSLISGGFLNFLADRTKQMKDELKALGDEDDDDEEDDFDPDDVTSSEGEENDDEEEGNEDDECDEEDGEGESEEAKDESKEEDEKENETKIDSEALDNKETENGVCKVDKPEDLIDSAGDAIKNTNAADANEDDTTESTSAKSSRRKKPSPKKLVVQPKVDGDKTEENEDAENGKDDSDTEEEDSELMNSDGVAEEDALMEKPGFDSGCTAVVALKVASKLYVANAGDSRCVLSLNSIATPLSRDHNPSLAGEIARVEAAGGKIEAGRVDGGLNLTRALGDHRYKQNSELPPEKQRISAEAEVTVSDLGPQSNNENSTAVSSKNNTSDFFVLACDGIWECLDNENVVSEITEKLSSHNLFQICHQMTKKCIAPSSKRNQTTGLDNMTIIIVSLQPHKLTTKFVHEPRSSKLKKCEEKNSESTNEGESLAEGSECDVDAKTGGDINANGVSDDTLTNGNADESKNEALGNGIEKPKNSDLKRPNESAFENGVDEDSQSCKALKTE